MKRSMTMAAFHESRRIFWRVMVTLLVVCAWWPSPTMAEDVVMVSVTGEGIAPDAARNDALRRALEEGGRVEISSYSQVANFQLIRDTIYSRAEGIVTDYQILDQGAGVGGVYYCKIRAKVSKTAIASTWGEVQNVLDQIGQPGIMVLIDEYIDGVQDSSSILESKIQEQLSESGFKIYDRRQILALANVESRRALLEGNTALLQATAANFGAQIFITGTAHANAAGMEQPYGVRLAIYNCDAVVTMFYTDTALLIATKSEPAWRGAARGHNSLSRQAAKTALSNAGAKIVEDIYRTCMQQWATQISAGAEVQLIVEGITMKEALAIKKKLRTIPGVDRVNGPSFNNGIGTYRIIAKMTAETMVEYLMEDDWAPLFEVSDLKLNRIQARKPGGG